MSIAYYNGEFCTPEQIRIPLSDRAIYFGDGIYDAAIGRNGKIYMESEHIDRFISNAERMRIPLSLDKNEISALLNECVSLSGETDFFIYFQLTRFMKERAHACKKSEKSNLLITVTKSAPPTPDKTMTLSLFEDKRYFYCNVKTLNLLPSVLASCDADERGFDEAVFLRDGTVTECAHSNIAIIKNGELFTHPECDRILSGTARKGMLDTALSLGMICRDIPFCQDALFDADEVIVTSSTKLARRVRRIENKDFIISSDSAGAKICEIMYQDFLKSTK